MSEKVADGLGVLGRLAAAAVLLKMLDSHQDRMRSVRATSVLRHMQEEQDMLGARPSQTFLPPHHGPRLFIPAGTPDALDEEQSRYQMGFIPNVPAGMDQGMVRLASDLGETMLKVALASGMVTKQASLIPPAPKNLYKPRRGLGPVLGPAGGAKPFPVSAPAKTMTRTMPAAPPTSAPPKPPSSTFNTTNVAGITSGLAAAGLAYGGYKALEKGVDYLSEEAPPTDWGLTRSGAPRLAQTTNPYGYPQIPR